MATFNPRNAMEVVATVLPKLATPQGQWTPFEAAATLYDTVEIRTNATPPIVLNVREMGQGNPGPNPAAVAMKPTIILSGPLGTKTIAPYGIADGRTGTVVSVGAVTGIALVIGGIGYALGRRSARRRAGA